MYSAKIYHILAGLSQPFGGADCVVAVLAERECIGMDLHDGIIPHRPGGIGERGHWT
jgi:hypothetical protein